jgi:hypothetical protein
MAIDYLGKYLRKAREWRDNWSEENPGRILSSVDKDNKYKIRKAWFQRVFGLAYHCRNQISHESLKAYEDFKQYAEHTDFYNRFTRRDDVDRMNKVLHLIIADLEKSADMDAAA